jgi:hypothetical protein
MSFDNVPGYIQPKTSSAKGFARKFCRRKLSFYPLLKPKISPGKNPMPAANGDPEAEPVECVANCDTVSLRVCIA